MLKLHEGVFTMILDFNKAIMFQLVGEIGEAVSHSGKSRDEILNILVQYNPELRYTKKDWENFNQETKNNIINRMVRTLNSI
jgi:hypothetical protein